MVEWPSEKKYPTLSGRLPVMDQLAGGVVDGRNVIGIEGVAHPQRVGQHPGPELKYAVRRRGGAPGGRGPTSPTPRC